MKKGVYLVLLVLVGSIQSFAQTIHDFKLLKGETEVEVVFTYDNLRLQKENYTEEEYIKVHMANLERKQTGLSTEWLPTWKQAKENIWESKFVSLANKHSKGKIKFVRNAVKTKYILVVDVTWIYTGWDAGVINQSAKVTSTVSLVSRENPTVVLAQHQFINMPGNQFANYSNEVRVGEGFAKTGKDFAKKIVKSI